MASTHLPHPSFAPTYTPSTRAIFLILISVFVVPFVALSSSELIPTTLRTAASSMLDSCFSLATSFPFYFFLLNTLIVALICLSGVFDGSSTRRELDDLQEGDLRQRDYFSAVHNAIQESLALSQFHETQGPSPSYLGFVESSGICVVNEAQGNEQAHGNDAGEKFVRKKITSLLENPMSSNDKCRDNVTFSASDSAVNSASEMHSTNAFDRIKSDVVVASTAPIKSSMMKSRLAVSTVSDHIADLHHGAILDGDETVGVKDVQVCNGHHGKYGDVCKNAEDDVIHGERDNITDTDDGDRANGSDTLRSAHDDGDEKFDFQAPDASDGNILPLQNQAMQIMGDDEQGNVGDVEDGDVSRAMAKNPGEEGAEQEGEGYGGASEGETREGGLEQHEQAEELSREELNQRASAFITAFRRKLISTATE